MSPLIRSASSIEVRGSSRGQPTARYSILDTRWLLLVALLLALVPLPARAQIPSISGDSDAYVEALVDRTDPWQGQQITYTFRYYEAVDALRLPGILVGQPDYEAPDFANFWQEGEIEQTNYQQTIGDRTYNVSELHTVLFPTAAGPVTIPPARLILRDMPGAAERFLETLPVTLDVKPLPANAPDTFAGAVGDFRLTAQVDHTITKVDEPVTLRLTLSGQGNVRLAPVPALPDLEGWRILERGEDVRVEKAGGQIVGTRTLDYLLLPTVGGSITLPTIEYLFFDPAAGEFRGALTEPIALTAEGAPASASAPAAQVAAGAPLTPTIDPTTNPAIALAAPGRGGAHAAVDSAHGCPLHDPGSAAAAGRIALVLGTLAGAPYGVVRGLGRQRARPSHRATQRPPLTGARRTRRLARCRRPARHARNPRRTGRPRPARPHRLPGPQTGPPRLRADPVGPGRPAPRPGAPAPAIATVQECLSLGNLARFSPSVVEPGMAAQMQERVGAAIRALEKVL